LESLKHPIWKVKIAPVIEEHPGLLCQILAYFGNILRNVNKKNDNAELLLTPKSIAS